MQWNAGGWFGGQIGGTAWMLVAGILSAINDIDTGLIVLATFAIPNVIGLFLWRSREAISCYKATQFLIPVMGVFGLIAIYVLDERDLWLAIQSGAPVDAFYMYLALVFMVIWLMVTFYFRFGRGR